MGPCGRKLGAPAGLPRRFQHDLKADEGVMSRILCQNACFSNEFLLVPSQARTHAEGASGVVQNQRWPRRASNPMHLGRMKSFPPPVPCRDPWRGGHGPCFRAAGSTGHPMDRQPCGCSSCSWWVDEVPGREEGRGKDTVWGVRPRRPSMLQECCESRWGWQAGGSGTS